MAYKIEEIEGIGPAFAAKLAEAKITNTDHLLKLCGTKAGRAKVAEQTGLKESQVLTWANMADLMRVSGVGGEFAELLKASGVDTVKELKMRKADNLAAKMAEVNEAKKLTRVVPKADKIASWIEAAKSIEPMITH